MESEWYLGFRGLRTETGLGAGQGSRYRGRFYRQWDGSVGERDKKKIILTTRYTPLSLCRIVSAISQTVPAIIKIMTGHFIFRTTKPKSGLWWSQNNILPGEDMMKMEK